MNFVCIGNAKHQIGQSSCDECLSGYPRKCHCGGMIHAEFGSQNLPSKYICDKCGDKFMRQLNSNHNLTKRYSGKNNRKQNKSENKK
jgi:hypothetical protein